MKVSAEIIQQIHLQLRDLQNVRAMFPAITSGMIGQSEFATAPFYQQRGFPITFRFSKPLTAERVEEISKIGRWLNQSFVIRLCALLESYQVIPTEKQGRINQEIDGHEEVDIIRRLRNVLAHTSGRYNSANPDERKLYERIVDRFSVEAESADSANEFPLPIDAVLIPLAKGCKRYIQGLA